VRAIENDLYVFEWGLDLLQYRDRNLVVRKQITPHDGMDVFSVLLDRQFVDFPLSVGKRWEFSVSEHPNRRVFEFYVLDIETIATPAGSFEAFKIMEQTRVIRGGRPGGSFTLRYLWYAPEVKFLVETLQVGGEPLYEMDPDYQLVAFDLK
jgi:hypothetical protein